MEAYVVVFGKNFIKHLCMGAYVVSDFL